LDDYGYFNIPQSCVVKNTIFKRLFYENTDLGPADKKLFTDVINKITWLYCLKPETVNIQSYKDDIREYVEIEFLEIKLEEDKKTDRIAEIIMRTIPYPMVLIFELHDRVKLNVAHQRMSLNDSSKNTIEEFISTDWIDKGGSLFDKLDIRKMRFTNFYALYSDIVDTISIYNASNILPAKSDLTGEEARELLSSIEAIEQDITSLKAKLKKETQFNRKMEMNIEIKKLEKEMINIAGGAIK